MYSLFNIIDNYFENLVNKRKIVEINSTIIWIILQKSYNNFWFESINLNYNKSKVII